MKIRTALLFFSIIIAMLACQLGTVTISIATPTPTVNPIPALSVSIPAIVEGTIVDKPTRDWSANPAQGMFRLVVRTTGGDVTVLVDVETFARAWWDQSIQLDCQQMPCVRVGLVTGKVIDAPQSSYTVTLDMNGVQRTFDVDPTVSLSVKVGQTITLDCVNLPCMYAQGEGQ